MPERPAGRHPCESPSAVRTPLAVPSERLRACFFNILLGNVQNGSSSKATGILGRGAYTAVREHHKSPRTPLATFFNIPQELNGSNNRPLQPLNLSRRLRP